MKASTTSKPPETVEEAWEALARLEAPELPEGMEDRFWLRLEQEEALQASTTSAPSPNLTTKSSPLAAFWSSFRWPTLAGALALSVLAGVFWVGPKRTDPQHRTAGTHNTRGVNKGQPGDPTHVVVTIPGQSNDKAFLKEAAKNAALYKQLAMFQKLAMFDNMEMFEHLNEIEKVQLSKKKGS